MSINNMNYSKKISIKNEWKDYIKFIKKNWLVSIIIWAILPSGISIIVLNSSFGESLIIYFKVLLFIILYIAFFMILTIIFIFKFLISLCIGKVNEIKKDIFILPAIGLPINNYFKAIFQNEKKRLKEVYYRVGYIESDENWNIKIALMSDNYEDQFYIIVHTRIPGDPNFFAVPGDSDNVLYIAMENKYLNDTSQKLGYKKNFPVKEFTDFKLEINKRFNRKMSEIKYYINGSEIKILNRVEKINNDYLNNISFEVWSTNYKKNRINIDSQFYDFRIVWG